jgi:hypothetical protein
VGVVPHLVSFGRRLDVALRIDGIEPPFSCGVGRDGLVVAYQREGAGQPGVVAAVDARSVLR